MFGLGFFEILVIALVAIIFINPKDLPKAFRRLGRLVRQLRDLRDSSAAYFRRIEREIEEQVEESRQAGEQPGKVEKKEPGGDGDGEAEPGGGRS